MIGTIISHYRILEKLGSGGMSQNGPRALLASGCRFAAGGEVMIGQTIAHYRIVEKLGGGGMGIVYRAEDTRLKRTVALKFLPPDLTRDPEAKQRCIHETQAGCILQHKTIRRPLPLSNYSTSSRYV